MAVVINEFEVAPAPPPSTQAAPPAPATSTEKKPEAQKRHEAERVIRQHTERLARVRAH